MNNITDLIIRAARGEASEAELNRLELWRARRPENEERYADLRRVVEFGRGLQQDVDTEPVSARSVIDRAAERGREAGAAAAEVVPSKPLSTGRRGQRWAFGAAGVAAAAAMLVIGFTSLADRGPSDLGPPGLAEVTGPLEYRTEADAGRSIQLPGGILAHLGPSSRLEIADGGPGQDTHIWLEGRAFFGVEGRYDRRVVVETPGGSISVIGTRFEAYSRDGELQLLVVDGTVGVTAPGSDEVRVTGGERGVVTQGVVEPPIQIEDPLTHLEWMGRGMVFQDTPLDQVASEISFRYGASVTLADPALAERTLTTVFDGQPLEEVVHIVCRAVRITCEVEDGAVVLGAE